MVASGISGCDKVTQWAQSFWGNHLLAGKETVTINICALGRVKTCPWHQSWMLCVQVCITAPEGVDESSNCFAWLEVTFEICLAMVEEDDPHIASVVLINYTCSCVYE